MSHRHSHPGDVFLRPNSGFAAMGKQVPYYRRAAALRHCREMGLTDTERATNCIDRMAEQLKRVEPYAAMQVGMEYLDLAGTYRLMAVLLTEPKPLVRVRAVTRRIP